MGLDSGTQVTSVNGVSRLFSFCGSKEALPTTFEQPENSRRSSHHKIIIEESAE